MKFYVLKSPAKKVQESSATTDFLKIEPVNRGDAPRCEACGKYIGMMTWMPPYRVELEIWNAAYGDLAFGPGKDMVVSERFKTLYKESGLTGMEGFDPVEVVRVRRYDKATGFKAKPPSYYHVSVVRSRTAIDTTISLIREGSKEICIVCRTGRGIIKQVSRVVVEPTTWTGEDIFIARGLPGTYVVSDRFKTFCEKHCITNAILIPAEEYREDFGL